MTGLILIATGCKEKKSRTAQSLEKPNIIFIITDDQEKGLLSIEGHPVMKTPNIDRIGEEGAVFNNFFVVTPLCSPSRASFLTGQYASSHRVINNDKLGLDVISHTLMTWPRHLRENGYETAFIGKWHMGLDDSRRPGFDRWVSFKGQGVYIDGVVNDEGMRHQITGYMTDYLNEQAVDYVNADHNDKPFALILSHKALHWPILPAKRYESLLSDYKFEPVPPGEEDLEGKPVLTRPVPDIDITTLEGVAPEPAEPRRGRGSDRLSMVHDNLRCLASVDEGIGDIYDALEKTGQLDNTIIIYTSDNGMLMGEHGEFDKKRWAYDPALRVPMLIRYPSVIPGGSVLNKMILNIDIAPTLLELAGVEPIIPMHGRSFVPLLNNSDAPWREAFLAEYFLEKCVPRAPSWKAIRTEKWKYIRYYGNAGILNELYDLENDPEEEHNLISEPSAQPHLQKLQQQLNKMLEELK